ncbi:hypothetical protein LINPERPRIM_LOCUS6100 [Linum perenne]
MPLIIIMAEFELVSMSSEHKDKVLGPKFAPHLVQEVVIGDKAPLRVVQDSAALLGEAAIPTVTLVVIVYLKSTLK